MGSKGAQKGSKLEIVRDIRPQKVSRDQIVKGHKWVQRAQVAEGGTSLEVGSKFVIMWDIRFERTEDRNFTITILTTSKWNSFTPLIF